MQAGHRAWRRIRTKLVAEGLVATFLGQVSGQGERAAAFLRLVRHPAAAAPAQAQARLYPRCSVHTQMCGSLGRSNSWHILRSWFSKSDTY